MENKKMERLAYIAGMMDGDGSFSLTKRNSLPSPMYYPQIQLTNKSKYLINYFYDEFGGYKHCRKSWTGKNGSTRKDSWKWNIEKKASKFFLEKIIPFLKLKKDRAIFLLNYLNKNPFRRGIKLNDEIIFKRQKDYLKMIQMNSFKDVSKSCSIKRRKTPTTDPLYWSYVAGILDSDGSFSIKRETKNVHNSYKYLPIISLSMTDIRGLDYIISKIPYGNLKIIKATNCKYGFNYRFSIHSHEECALFIERCIPYLKLKQENAKTLHKFCKNKKRTLYCRGGVSEEENSFREECYQELLKINNGVYKSPLIDLEVLQLDDRGEDVSRADRLNKETSI